MSRVKKPNCITFQLHNFPKPLREDISECVRMDSLMDGIGYTARSWTEEAIKEKIQRTHTEFSAFTKEMNKS